LSAQFKSFIADGTQYSIKGTILDVPRTSTLFA
jgi:hypothetical protein